MTKLRKKLTEKTRKFGAEVRRRHSTGLTPESEVCYEDVPKSFPSDWFDESDDFEPKKEAPVRAHKEFKKFRRLLERNAIKSFIVEKPFHPGKVKDFKKKLNREALNQVSDEELYYIHERLFKFEPILHGFGPYYPQNEAERKALIDAILNGEPLDVTKDDPPGVLY